MQHDGYIYPTILLNILSNPLIMEHIATNDYLLCGCCHRQLPPENFYISNKKTQKHDNYCKECRKECSSKHYRQSQFVDSTPSYTVITDVTDDNKRMALILQALRVVNDSMARRRRKLIEQEAKEDPAPMPTDSAPIPTDSAATEKEPSGREDGDENDPISVITA